MLLEWWPDCRVCVMMMCVRVGTAFFLCVCVSRGGGWRGGHQQGVCSLCFSQGPLQQCCDEGALSGDLEMLLNTNILRGQKSLRAPPQASKPPLKEPVTSLSLSLFLSLSPIPHLSLCPRLSLSLSLTFSLSRPPSLYSFLLSSVIIPVIISSF